MCLSTVYKGTEASPENKLAEYVTRVDTETDGSIHLADITGAEFTFSGSLRHIDLISNHIFIDLDS